VSKHPDDTIVLDEMHVVALSGGKDSTALALRLAETRPDVDFVYLCTPTGDELPSMSGHWDVLECMLGRPLTRITNQTLDAWIDHFKALPNWRQRWCTRLLKIEPCLAWIRNQGGPVTLYVGLRADEEERKGIYSDDVETAFPLREWGWGVKEVQSYLRERGVKIPKRTDCARCPYQRLPQWWDLWNEHPDIYDHAAQQEQTYGHTFRSPARDSWPADLKGLAEQFSRGRVPSGIDLNLSLFDDDEEDVACRVCSL